MVVGRARTFMAGQFPACSNASLTACSYLASTSPVKSATATPTNEVLSGCKGGDGAGSATTQSSRCSSELYAYLCSSQWTLFKRLEYRRGGSFGSWSGEVQFTPDPTRPLHLLYTEVGALRFDHQSKDSAGVASTAKPLVFDCLSLPPRVHFIEEDGTCFLL
jgi:hypothetical protein